jgi:hypothetical protein
MLVLNVISDHMVYASAPASFSDKLFCTELNMRIYHMRY